MSLYNELKRRNVFRVAIAYLALAWLLTEVSGTLFPAFGIPEWGVRFVVIVFALGFAPALIITWVYELTPEGIKREKDVVRDASITHLTAKRLDVFTIGLIVVALAFILTDRFWLSPRHAEQSAALPAVVIDTVQTPEPEPQYPPNSIAVLPFANRSANPDDAYFVDGIHDDLLTYISKIGAIKTISRTSVMQYRNSDKTVPEIAGELGVSTILEGGVQRAGDQIRINVQLIDAQSDEHLWAEIYDRHLSAGNIFAIQSEISIAISEALQAVLSPEEQQRIQAIPTESLEAYEAYLFGKQRMARRDTDSLKDAVKYLTEAVEIDPQFALAWSALGDTYLLQRENSGVSEHELLLNAQNAIEKALETDPKLGEAYTSLGMLRHNFDDEKGAEQSYRKAIDLVPNYSVTYHWYSILLRNQGRDEEVFEMISMAAQLDPMSPIIKQNLAIALRSEGRHEEALEELEKAIAIDPAFARAYDAKATMDYLVFNRLARAMQAYVKVIELDPSAAIAYVWPGQLYLELGAPDRAGMLFDQSRTLVPDSFGAHWGELLLGVFQGDTDGINDNVNGILKSTSNWHWIAQFSAAQLRNRSIASKEYMQALDVYSTTYPRLLDDPGLTIGLHNYRAAIDLALVLQKTGEWEKANDLLDQCHDFIRKRPRLGWWGGYWISDVLILALKGEKTEALSALRDGVDEGWRSMWWYYLRHDPNLDSIRNEPEFQLIVSEIEADMSAQMQQIREMEYSGEIAAVPGVVFNSE
jgi:TolB-like protein/Flp pilus assembly protein TadD